MEEYTLISCIYSYNYPPTNFNPHGRGVSNLSLLRKREEIFIATQQLLIFPIVEQRKAENEKLLPLILIVLGAVIFATLTTHIMRYLSLTQG